MDELNPEYMVAVAEQLSFVSAFLGGISITILITIVVCISEKRSVNWIISTSALAAASLLIAVVAAWRIMILLHPSLPISYDPELIKYLWAGMLLGYSLGFLSLLVSIGLSGWLRSKRDGWVTSFIALIAIVFFVVATPFGVN